MKAIQIEEFGDPRQVLKVVDLPDPGAPGPGEVLLAVEYAPLNFHDVHFIEGFMKRPLPLVQGNEGVGRVVQVGEGVSEVGVGDHVAIPLMSGSWRERLLISASTLSPLPDADLKQLSMLSGNPPTAALALSEYGSLRKGDWVVQNASNGGVGRNVIAFAKRRGIKTVNLVRRPEVIDELKAVGADVVVVDGPDAVQQIRDQIGADTALTVAIDGIGGDGANTLLELLSPGGAIVGYNNVSGTPYDAELLADKNLTATKLFVGAYDRPTRLVPIVAEAAEMIASGEISVPVEAVYPLEEIQAALDHLYRGGKILLAINPTDA